MFRAAPYLALLLLLAACDSVTPDEDPLRADLLVQGEWSLAGTTFLSGGGEARVADRFLFQADGSLRTTFFRPGQETLTETSRWTLTPDQQAVILFQEQPDEPAAGRLDIVELTAARFVFEATITQGRIRVTLSR